MSEATHGGPVSIWHHRLLGGLWAALVPVAALYFLDMLLMFGWVGSRAGVWTAVAALGIAAYTLVFLVISASHRLYGSP